jgi:hypothetical protein
MVTLMASTAGNVDMGQVEVWATQTGVNHGQNFTLGNQNLGGKYPYWIKMHSG